MKLGFFISCFLLTFTLSSYAATLPSEGYVSPYTSPEKTSIWGSSIEADNGSGEATASSNSSSPMRAGEHGTWAWCPYCIALWGYGPETNYDYFDCLESADAIANCTYPDCEVHSAGAETPLPISNSIIPLLIFSLGYAVIRYRKMRNEVREI